MATDRTGLYIMVFLILMSSCSNGDDLAKLKRKVNDLEKIILNSNVETDEYKEPSF